MQSTLLFCPVKSVFVLCSIITLLQGPLNLKGRNGPTTFLPLSPKIGGQVNNNRPNVGQYLTREQANYVYKKPDIGEVINTETLKQELDHERQLNRIDDTSGETNPYKELIVNNAEKI